jgi:hypothetical protein
MGKINIDRKRLSYIQKACFEKSQNYSGRDDRTSELNIHLQVPVSTKNILYELQKSNIHGRAAIPKPLVSQSNAQLRKRWCHDYKNLDIRQLGTRA